MKFNSMERYLFIVSFFLFSAPLFAQYMVTGGVSETPLLAEDERNNHLQIYLLDGMSNARITFTSSDSNPHQWYKYKVSANEAISVSCIQTGNLSYITDIEEGYGYFVGSPTIPSTEYVWIIDYSLYLPRFNTIRYEEEEDRCEALKIVADVDAEPLIYITPLGVRKTLDRVYRITYRQKIWSEDAKTFISEDTDVFWKGIISEYIIDDPTAPLEDTDFTLTGDQFAEYFKKGLSMKTPVYSAVSIQAHGFAETTNKDGEIEIAGTGTMLGGSAPITYTFTAYANEPVAALFIWKVSHYNESTNVWDTKVRYTDKILRYTFSEEGNYRVGLEVSDYQSVCVDTTQIFSVFIGTTTIKIPNFFSPGSSIGSNDEFKVSYTSLLSFRASIYNRWGNLLYQWTDPDKGWDGRVNGKFVPTGAYVVIVEYTDTGGRKKSESRTLNILRGKN